MLPLEASNDVVTSHGRDKQVMMLQGQVCWQQGMEEEGRLTALSE
jgi:hypothetical protein